MRLICFDPCSPWEPGLEGSLASLGPPRLGLPLSLRTRLPTLTPRKSGCRLGDRARGLPGPGTLGKTKSEPGDLGLRLLGLYWPPPTRCPQKVARSGTGSTGLPVRGLLSLFRLLVFIIIKLFRTYAAIISGYVSPERLPFSLVLLPPVAVEPQHGLRRGGGCEKDT